nr:complement regulator-acquiring protein [Borreliella burgdorferi]
MTKNKLNKINIIAAILTLIGTSCAVNPIDPKVKSRTDIKESNQKSGNPESLNQKYQEETKVSKLEALTKKLKDQKNE